MLELKKEVSPKVALRAKQVIALAAKEPALEDAIRSRNNLTFRLACVKLMRAAKDEDAALTMARILQVENMSAFMQFAWDNAFDLGDKTKAPVASGPIDVDSLFDS